MEQPTETYKRWKAAEWIAQHGVPKTPGEDDFCRGCGRPWVLCPTGCGELKTA